MLDIDPFKRNLDPTITQITDTKNDLNQEEDKNMFNFIKEHMMNHELIVQNNKNQFYAKMLP